MKKKIFIGSSTEANQQGLLDKLALIIENSGHLPVLWTDPDSFIAGNTTLESLFNIANRVDAAIFIFTEDDKTWYRKTEITLDTPRDNVVFELGLFMGWFKNVKKALMIKVGKSKVLTDLSGYTYIDFTEERQREGKIRILNWLKALDSTDEIIIPSINDYHSHTQKVNNLGFYIENDRRVLSFESSIAYNGLLQRKYSNIYTVLSQQKTIANFKLSFYNEFILPDKITDLKSVIKFFVSSPICNFTIEDCEVSSIVKNGRQYGKITLTKYLDVPTGTTFRVNFESLVQEYVNIETFSARYPTKGFHVSLEYSDKYHYDHQYFKANTFLSIPNSDLEEFLNNKKNGIETSTNEWFYIGEGIAISWFPT